MLRRALQSTVIAAVVVTAPLFAALPTEDPPPADVSEVVRGNNDFAFELYRSVFDGDGENLFLSPLSIRAALAMAYAGAEGATAAEMAEVLKLDLPADQRHAAFAELYDLLVQGEEAPSELAIANALWVDRGFELRPEYVELLAEAHGAPAREVAMRGDGADVINEWVEEQTRGRIDEIVDEGALEDAALVLTNAIYFLGTWQYEFDPEQTRDEPFTLAGGSQRDVPLMHQRGSFRYAENEHFQAIDLPYSGGSLHMTVLLPREPDGLPALVERLDAEVLDETLGAMRPRDTRLYLPRFELRASLDLVDALRALGMPTALDPNRADFGEMADLPPDRRLFISDVLHRAFVSLDEEGTEAAAATAVVVSVVSVSVDTPQPVVFRADRPFLLLIRDAKTGAVLFTGHVAEPAAFE